jgi:hypothetical protein
MDVLSLLRDAICAKHSVEHDAVANVLVFRSGARHDCAAATSYHASQVGFPCDKINCPAVRPDSLLHRLQLPFGKRHPALFRLQGKGDPYNLGTVWFYVTNSGLGLAAYRKDTQTRGFDRVAVNPTGCLRNALTMQFA